MSFENAKYSTAEKVQDTIQDKIDSKKLEINKDTISKLKNLKVDILNDESKLNVRDEKGRVIGKLKEGQHIDLSGDYKEVNGKVFLGVKYGIRTGFVSADYIKGDIEKNNDLYVTKGAEHKKDNNNDSKNDKNTPPTNPSGNNDTTKNEKKVIVEEKDGNKKPETNEIKYIAKFKIPNGLEKNISENKLNLDIKKSVSKYESYLNNELKNLPKEQKDKLVEAINKKIAMLNKIIEERIDWVDEQIEEGDYKKEDRVKEIQNQRWIINKNFSELFSDFNNKVIPSLIAFQKGIISDSDIKQEITEMMKAEITDEGEFDQSIWNGLYDGTANNWNILDYSDEDNAKFLEKKGISKVDTESLLSENDRDIEDTAQIGYMAALAALVANDVASFTGIWTIPGLVIGAGYDIHDVFSDEDTAIVILKSLGIVDENYMMEKGLIDNLLATIGIIPGVTAIYKGKKIQKFYESLKNSDKNKFNKIKNDFLNKAKNFNFGKNKANNSNSSLNGVDFIVDSKGNTKINNFKPKKGFSEDIINRNKSLEKEDRINESIKLLGKDLSEKQKNTIMKAHNIEDTNLLEKVRILKSANFNKLEREKLLRSGLCGSNKIFNKEEITLIDNKFKKALNEALEKNNNIKIGNKNIIKRSDGNFEIEGGNGTILKKKQLLDSLTTNEKYDLLLNKTIDKVKKLEGVIKLEKNGFLDFKGKYRISKDEILVKDNGKLKKLNKAEETQFYKDHGLEMIEKVYGVSFKDVSNLSNKYLIDYLKKVKKYEYKGDSKIAKAVHGTFNWTADQLTSPHRIIKEITKVKDYKQLTKAILFGKHNIDWIGDPTKLFIGSGLSKTVGVGSLVYLETAILNEDESGYETAAKYLSLMYMPILWPIILQSSGAYELLNTDDEKTTD